MELLEYGLDKSTFIFASKTQVLGTSSNHSKQLLKKTLEIYGECLTVSILIFQPKRNLSSFRSEIYFVVIKSNQITSNQIKSHQIQYLLFTSNCDRLTQIYSLLTAFMSSYANKTVTHTLCLSLTPALPVLGKSLQSL